MTENMLMIKKVSRKDKNISIYLNSTFSICLAPLMKPLNSTKFPFLHLAALITQQFKKRRWVMLWWILGL